MLWKTYGRLIRRSLRISLWAFLVTMLLCGMPLADEQASPVAGKKILWVDSYHQTYEWTAGIEQGIRRRLQNSGVELRIVRMDSKRRSSEGEIRGAALRAKAEITNFQPDVVIASDDNAVKYLVVPYLKNADLPVVFSGVNWDASLYGLPARNVTGMIEIDLVETQVEHLSRYAKGQRIGFLSGDRYSEHKIIYNYNRLFFNGQMKSYLVRNMREFKDYLIRAQSEVDMLYINNYTGIEDWDPVAAEQFIVEHIKVPTGSHNPFMAPFVLVTLAKAPHEHGEWMAATALKILAGQSPEDIPLARSQRGHLIINLKMAKALEVVFPIATLEAATVIGQEALDSKPKIDQ